MDLLNCSDSSPIDVSSTLRTLFLLAQLLIRVDTSHNLFLLFTASSPAANAFVRFACGFE